ncbi:immunoglobulin kappa light chain-like isoform X1 [Pleurodeles waltl]|uniref:immunoglobulin kappa light chain-like isoform X1 n=1 Tax=Pleurodeles waltl TaxID=8319 RepID=UPI003709875A
MFKVQKGAAVTERMRLLQIQVFCVLVWTSYTQAQKPVISPTVEVSLGQRTTISCEVGVKDAYAVPFYRQIPGEAPEAILYHHYSWSDPQYGPGMSSAHFTAKVNSAGTGYQLIIKDVQITDAAHYYCAKWYTSVNGWVFSQSSQLIVTGANFPDADMMLFPPQPVEPSGGIQPTLTCLISNLSVPFGTVSWKVDGKVVQNAITSEPKRDTSSNTFSMSSYLTLPEVDHASTFTCQIQQAGSASIASRSLKLSECA